MPKNETIANVKGIEKYIMGEGNPNKPLINAKGIYKIKKM